jgi:hypothetical protein
MSDDDRDEDHLLRKHMEKAMTLEIPDPVLEVIKDVVLWSRGSNGHGEVSLDDVLCGMPLLDEWCVARGLLPARTFEGQPDDAPW